MKKHVKWTMKSIDQATLEYLAQVHKGEKRGAINTAQARRELARRKKAKK